MAASLLGPLIPSEVKEAEEKWRKRLLKGLDEPENTPDSEGEGAPPAGSPANPLQDPDSAPTVQKELCIKKQSGENVAEEEAEEDTMELELALERKKVRGERDLCATLVLSGFTFKPFFSVLFYLFLFIWQMFMAAVCGSNLLSDFKAELRALEEGDGSAGGSSPCSETSQEASASHGLLLKKNRWKTAFPCAASPDSSSRGSDLQDNTETGECMPLQASYWRVVCMTAVNGYFVKNPICSQKILHAFLTFWPVATSKVLESVAEGEDKEKDSGEETTVTKPLGKEEAEVSELKVETPELKVK